MDFKGGSTDRYKLDKFSRIIWWCKVEFFFSLINGSRKWLNFSNFTTFIPSAASFHEKLNYLILWHAIKVYRMRPFWKSSSVYFVIYCCVKSAQRRNNWKSFILRLDSHTSIGNSFNFPEKCSLVEQETWKGHTNKVIKLCPEKMSS